MLVVLLRSLCPLLRRVVLRVVAPLPLLPPRPRPPRLRLPLPCPPLTLVAAQSRGPLLMMRVARPGAAMVVVVVQVVLTLLAVHQQLAVAVAVL